MLTNSQNQEIKVKVITKHILPFFDKNGGREGRRGEVVGNGGVIE